MAGNPTNADDQALNTLLADSTADQTKRAKAFEEKYPGITARVGENGEMSFSNVPGRDVYGPYMKEAVQTPVGKEAVEATLGPDSAAGQQEKAAAIEALGPEGTIATVTEDGQISTTVLQPDNTFMQPVNSDNLFAQQYKQIASLTNVEDIVNARANMIQSTEDWIVTKHQTYKAKAENAQNVSGLQAEVKKNEMADRAAYAQFNEGVDLGDSDETLLVKAQLSRAQEKATQEAALALDQDPEIKGARARLQAIDSLTSSRMSAAEAEAVKEGKLSTSQLDELALPKQVAAVQSSLGQDPSQPMDPKLERQLRTEIIAGRSTRLTEAMEIGLIEDKDQLLATSMQPGSKGLYASNALRNKLNGNADLEKTLKAEAKKAQAEALAPPLDKNGKPKAGAIPLTKDEKSAAAVQALATARQRTKIARDAQFEGNPGQWQLPQDPELQAEVKNTLAVMQAERDVNAKEIEGYQAATDPTQTFEGLVARLNLRTPDGQPDKIKMQKVANWYASQANQVPGNDYFGPPDTALNPLDRVNAIVVRGQAIDRGLYGKAVDALGATINTVPAVKVARAAVTAALSIGPAADEFVFGTGKPIAPVPTTPVTPASGNFDYNPAITDPNYEIVTNYYRGRAGVDPNWIADRDRNIAAAKGGQ